MTRASNLYTEDGCDLHTHCLTCPFSKCRYEMAPGVVKAEMKRIEYMGIIESGKTQDEAISELGISKKTAYRYYNAHQREKEGLPYVPQRTL